MSREAHVQFCESLGVRSPGATHLFNTLFRTDAKRMTSDGYEWGSSGRERFTRDFGVIETIERITVEDNACSKKTKKTVTIKRKPGASPALHPCFSAST